MSAQHTPSDQNPPFSVHLKMLVVCFGTAVALAGGIATFAYVSYVAVMWIGSH